LKLRSYAQAKSRRRPNWPLLAAVPREVQNVVSAAESKKNGQVWTPIRFRA